jgi:protoporphyrinogen oxidase
MKNSRKQVLVIGAGSAGLTAACELLKHEKFTVTVLEREAVVGGLAKTIEYKKCRYDIGSHHFITDSQRVIDWWQSIMGNDFKKHHRVTRIFYKKHYFNYPLEPLNAIRGLSLIECIRSILSYAWIRFFPIKEARSLQDYVCNQFGRRLFSIFFKTYYEKVWGVGCDQVSGDWGAQRIKGFSLSQAIYSAFFGRWSSDNNKQPVNEIFYYPSGGTGTLWQRVADRIQTHEHGVIELNTDVASVEHTGNRITALLIAPKGQRVIDSGARTLSRYNADYFFSTMPLRTLIMAMNPLPPMAIIHAANSLRYRGLINVNLIVDKAHVCPDHSLYIHGKDVRLGRVNNMNNFSSKMVDDPQKHTALSLEYFSYVDEPFWFKSDYELIELGKKELEKIGLVKAAAVIDGMIVRTPAAYPIYDSHYKEHLGVVLAYLAQFENLSLMGRNGMHSYNNMDVAMLSAFDAVDAVVAHQAAYQQPVKPGHVESHAG